MPAVHSTLLILPFMIQALAMGVDEFAFHRSRVLPRWERIGHPLDTLTVAVPLGFCVFLQPAPLTVWLFAALALFSSLFVTKDEIVHARHCTPAEHWLHAVLFVLHPLIFISAAMLWLIARGRLEPIFHEDGTEITLLTGMFILTVLFGIFQAVYWNLLCAPVTEKKDNQA